MCISFEARQTDRHASMHARTHTHAHYHPPPTHTHTHTQTNKHRLFHELEIMRKPLQYSSVCITFPVGPISSHISTCNIWGSCWEQCCPMTQMLRLLCKIVELMMQCTPPASKRLMFLFVCSEQEFRQSPYLVWKRLVRATLECLIGQIMRNWFWWKWVFYIIN